MNYKNPKEGVDIGGYVRVINESEKIKYLINPTGATSTLHDIADGQDYQVPTGKKFKIIYIEEADQRSANDRIIATTAADATTGEVSLCESGQWIQNAVFISDWVSSGYYITRVDATSTAIYKIYGVEVDA